MFVRPRTPQTSAPCATLSVAGAGARAGVGGGSRCTYAVSVANFSMAAEFPLTITRSWFEITVSGVA